MTEPPTRFLPRQRRSEPTPPYLPSTVQVPFVRPVPPPRPLPEELSPKLNPHLVRMRRQAPIVVAAAALLLVVIMIVFAASL